MKYWLITLLFCLFCSALPAADKFIVGTNTDFAPFSYRENGKIVGFDIEVATEVAKRLGKEIEWRDMPFDALIPTIALNQVDFVAAGLSSNEERSKRMLFTKNYIEGNPLVVFTLGEKGYSVDELDGKTVVVAEGFMADLYMSDRKGVNLVRLPTQTDAFMAVKSGRADAFVTAKSTVQAFAKQQKDTVYQIVDIPGTGDTCAIALPKAKTALLEQIQKTLDAMEADGTMKGLKTKWNLL